ncbi:unnamed protein product [Prunus armeniaca]
MSKFGDGGGSGEGGSERDGGEGSGERGGGRDGDCGGGCGGDGVEEEEVVEMELEEDVVEVVYFKKINDGILGI